MGVSSESIWRRRKLNIVVGCWTGAICIFIFQKLYLDFGGTTVWAQIWNFRKVTCQRFWSTWNKFHGTDKMDTLGCILCDKNNKIFIEIDPFCIPLICVSVAVLQSLVFRSPAFCFLKSAVAPWSSLYFFVCLNARVSDLCASARAESGSMAQRIGCREHGSGSRTQCYVISLITHSN